MDESPFATQQPNIIENPALRDPQRLGYEKVVEFAAALGDEREAGIVLPVGCGKSGLIALCPFAFKARRVLVVAPGVNIYEQLERQFDPSSEEFFYLTRRVLAAAPYPEPVPLRSERATVSDLETANVVIANIQSLQGAQNRWITALPQDFFDLILVDEAHHNVAASWETLRRSFPAAKFVNFSATPLRADGQLMAGRIIYSYPISDAIRKGYVKRLKACVLNPRTLKFVRNDGTEQTVSLEEVRRLGEDDADFRKSIVTSKETLSTIVDASIGQLRKRRTDTGDVKHKIIAAALNYETCQKVVKAYRERGLRADFVHSREDGAANDKVMKKLAAHELDVIVQVRKLGEGFDHPYLSVAAIFSLFASLSPFVQFVGRVMRTVVQDSPGHVQNLGVVVFHAGANVARQWKDFQNFSKADQEFFDELLPMEELNFERSEEILLDPIDKLRDKERIEITDQTDVRVAEIGLLEEDDEARRAFELLQQRGFTPDDYRRETELRRVPVTKFRAKEAAQKALSERVQTEAGRILKKRGVNPKGHDYDRKRLRKTNFQVVVAALWNSINGFVGRKSGEAKEKTAEELARIDANLNALIEAAETEVFDGEN